MNNYGLARSDLLDDPVLGRVVADAARAHWVFNLLLPNGRMVPAVIVPEDDGVLPSETMLARVRERIGWLRDNEPAVRDHITKKMHDLWLRGWCHEQGEARTTRDQFRERIWLATLTILEGRRLSLRYNDGQLFGGQYLVQSINPRGKFDGAPDLCGPT